MVRKKSFAKRSLRQMLIEIAEWMMALCLVIKGNSLWVWRAGNNDLVTFITILLLTTCIIVVFASQQIDEIRFRRIIIFVVFSGMYFLTYLGIHLERIRTTVKLWLTVSAMFAYFQCYSNGKEIPEVLKKYSAIVAVIAVESVIMWLLCSVFRLLPRTGVYYTSWAEAGGTRAIPSWYNIYYVTQQNTSFVFGRFDRNTAIFTEAPMASFHFCTALLLESFENRKHGRWSIIALLVAVFSTNATTGIAIAGSTLLALLVLDGKGDSILSAIRMLVAPFIIIVTVYFLMNTVLSKTTDTTSGLTRVDDFRAGYRAWMHSPLFGNGLSGGDEIRQYMSTFRSDNTGFSNSLFQILNEGGVYFALPYVTAFYLAVRKAIAAKNWYHLVFVIEFLLMFVVTITSYQYLVHMILIWLAFGRVKENTLPRQLRFRDPSYRSKMGTRRTFRRGTAFR